MDSWLDMAMGLVASRLTRSRIPTPSVGLLGEARMYAAASALERHGVEARALAQAIESGEPGAAERFGALADRALDEMRAEVRERARSLGPPETLAAEVDARWSNDTLSEHLDDPDLDRELRVRLIGHLDRFNTLLGTYHAFLRAMEPLLDREGTTRVLDLAAGHGGFALEATRIARERRLAISFTATDLKPEYLALGMVHAEREGLDVAFAPQDALDLSNIEVGAYDVVVCTQSLHHFSASMIARMFRESVRIAGRGVVMIDGCRSALQGIVVPAMAGLRFFDRELAHDAYVSFRRFFAPEELGLLARLGHPNADEIEAKWMRPAHCLVRWRRPR